MKIRVLLARIKKRIILESLKLYDLAMDSDLYLMKRYEFNGYHNPNYRFDKSKISFVHVPKTAGTSLSLVLQDNSKFINIQRHSPVSKYCSPKDYSYITVIRDPIDRVWSQYQMILRGDENYPYKNYAKKGLLNLLENCWATRNVFCRYYSGVIRGEPTEKIMRLAQQNLGSFQFVLNFENISEDAVILAKTHNITLQEMPNERKASYPAPTEEESALIQRYNMFDLQLYREWNNSQLIN